MDFRVGPWLVQPATNTLTHGGHSSRVSPRAMEVLICLAKGEGRVLSKDDVFRQVWPDTYVTDDALTRCISELRHAFHDTARKPWIIETIAKRGYRIVAPVVWDTTLAIPDPQEPSTAQASAHHASTRKRQRALVAAGFVVLVSVLLRSGANPFSRIWRDPPLIQAVAVLPLANLSGDPEQGYFADAMTDELITAVAQIDAWKVISRTSIMRYKGTNLPVPAIARELAVDAILEGSVVRSGSRVRVTAQLIDAASDTHLWSGSFQREVSDVLALQREIARAVAAELKVKTAPQELPRANRQRRVVPEAYEPYVKGWYFFERSAFRKAASYFEQAAAKDPSFGSAFALLYEAAAMDSFRQDLPLSDGALRALEKASELDSSLAEVRTGKADVKFYWAWDWSACESEFRRAAELDRGSTNAGFHYALCLHALSQWDAASREYERVLRLDPVSPRTNTQWLAFLIDAQRYTEALEQFRKTLELDTNYGPAYTRGGALFEALGRETEAVRAYLRADLLTGTAAHELEGLERAANIGGLRGYRKKHLDLLRQRANSGRVPYLDFATLYVQLADNNNALEMLGAAYQQHAPGLAWVRASAVWRPLRTDYRYQSLLRRMRFPSLR